MNLSKTKIDKAGYILSNSEWQNDEQYLEYDYIFDEYRKNHLIPLTEITLKLQEWLTIFSSNYYIAQRLKRKPQIMKKLVRLSVRFTQLQDIGGCRIIVENNELVDTLVTYIQEKLVRSHYFNIIRITDYREKGRDVTGYRAVHMIVERNNYKIEVQLRSRIQHYWAESIERASVIYGYQLKEMEGDKTVINYFKAVSDVFFEIELGNKPHYEIINNIDNLRIQAEQIIKASDKNGVYTSSINEAFIKGMIGREARLRSKFHNWLIVFNWNNGSFIEWQLVDRDPSILIRKYSEYEKQYNASLGYEVVIIGSSNVSTIQHTHKHYFGIESYDSILENINESIISMSKRKELSFDSRLILTCLYKKDFWGMKKMSIDTLKNHYCKNLNSIDEALKNLTILGIVLYDSRKKSLSLNLKRKLEIESFMGFSA